MCGVRNANEFVHALGQATPRGIGGIHFLRNSLDASVKDARKVVAACSWLRVRPVRHRRELPHEPQAVCSQPARESRVLLRHEERRWRQRLPPLLARRGRLREGDGEGTVCLLAQRDGVATQEGARAVPEQRAYGGKRASFKGPSLQGQPWCRMRWGRSHLPESAPRQSASARRRRRRSPLRARCRR